MTYDPTLDDAPPDPSVTAALLRATDDAVAAAVLRRLASDPDRWRPLLRDLLDLAAHAGPDALLAAAHDLAPPPTPDYWLTQHARALEVARVLVESAGPVDPDAS